MNRKMVVLGRYLGVFGQNRYLMRGTAVAVIVAALFLWGGVADAAPTSADQARLVVENWLQSDYVHLGFGGGVGVRNVETFSDADGAPLYYVAYLTTEGLVVVSADDQVEPIIAFVKGNTYDPSMENPLGALISRDVPTRVRRARNVARSSSDEAAISALDKWARLLTPPATTKSTGMVSQVRVAPLVRSQWSQGTDDESYEGDPCYNYYTPNEYVCGCVATAMSQVMKFHEHPSAPVGTPSFTIEVDDVPQSRSLRGGDGIGGPYGWSRMVLLPRMGCTQQERQAIGALTHDAGVSVSMSYSAGGSGAWMQNMDNTFKEVFGYSNAVVGYNNLDDIGPGVIGMINPNLDFGHPVVLGIRGTYSAHAIVCDGYGYDSATLYHHLNMGWSGACDIWYNLPIIDSLYGTYDSVDVCIYNLFVTGSGEIISGRVLTKDGVPIVGAVVTAVKAGGETYTVTTNDAGVYAIGKLPSNTAFTMSAEKPGWYFNPKQFSTGSSQRQTIVSGNLWEANLDDGVPAYRLTVNSTGVSGVPITGTHTGETDYLWDLPKKTAITLTAPDIYLDSGTGKDYRFLRWRLNGTAQTPGAKTLSATLIADVGAVAVYEEIPHLDSIQISGPTEVDEGLSATYSCTAFTTTGTSSAVTPIWSVSPDTYASVDTDGLLTVTYVSDTEAVTISASYTSDESITKEDTHAVAILNVVPTILRVSPAETVLVEGEPIDIEIELANAPPVGALQFDVVFDPSMLQLTGEPVKAAMMGAYTSSAWPTAAELNGSGSGTFALQLPGGETPAQRTGVVVQMQFEFVGALTALPTDIRLLDTIMLDPASGAMAHETADGAVVLSGSITPPPVTQDFQVDFPTGDCVLVQGEKVLICWSCDEPVNERLRVELVNGVGETWELSSKAKPTKPLKWTVGKWKSKTQAVYPDGTEYYIQVSTLDDSKTGVCATPFTICTPTHLEITGPDEVNEGETAAFECMAYFTCGCSDDVTQAVKWKSKGKGAKLNKAVRGQLDASEVDQDEVCTLTVKHKIGKTKLTETKAVTIKNQ
jgi:hypothetical protein